MKMLILGAAVLLLAPSMVTALGPLAPAEPVIGPRGEMVGETIEVLVPAGYALVATATAYDFTVRAVPVEEAMAIQNHDGAASGCAGLLGVPLGWVRNGINSDCNTANYQSHGATLSSVTVVVIGPGSTFADALSIGSFSYWSTSCTGPLYVGGGVGSCVGAPFPGGFTGPWDALVQSNAVIGGAIYE